MKNDRMAHLWCVGNEPRPTALIAPIETDAARGTSTYGEFVLEHRTDGDSLVMMLTREGEDNPAQAAVISVEIPAALIRDLLNKAPGMVDERCAGART